MSEAVSTQTFEELVVKSDKPVLVDFWAPWCGPCRALSPAVEEVGNELADKLTVLKCNVDEEPELAQKFQIVSIPTLIVFKEGKAVTTMVGNRPKEDLLKEIQAAL